MDNTSIAITVVAAATIFAAAVIYLKYKSSPLLIKTATGDTGDEDIPDETPNLRFISRDELEDLYDSLEEESFRIPDEDDGEYFNRLRNLVQELERIIMHSARVYDGQTRIRNDKALQQKVVPLLALRRRILDELMFMAAIHVHEETKSLEGFNRHVRELEAKGCQIMPKAGLDSCRCFVTDGIYGSDFRTMHVLIAAMNPENYGEIYDDVTYAESSMDAFEGMDLCGSVREMHRRLYSLPDLARVRKLSLTETNTNRNNEPYKKYIS